MTREIKTNFVGSKRRNKLVERRSIKRLRGSCSVMGFELYALLCSAVGWSKTRLLFDKNRLNKLEIGIGNGARKQGFITSDLNMATDYPFDLRIGLPFPNESIDLIYAEHVLEHFSYRDLLLLLSDCYRVLKSDGRLSLAVPDTRIWLDAYCKEQDLDVEKYCGYDCGLAFKSRIDYLNYIFYMDGHHRHMFDEKGIVTVLEDAGFQNARIRDFQGELDQEARRFNSLYAEAYK